MAVKSTITVCLKYWIFQRKREKLDFEKVKTFHLSLYNQTIIFLRE